MHQSHAPQCTILFHKCAHVRTFVGYLPYALLDFKMELLRSCLPKKHVSKAGMSSYIPVISQYLLNLITCTLAWYLLLMTKNVTDRTSQELCYLVVKCRPILSVSFIISLPALHGATGKCIKIAPMHDGVLRLKRFPRYWPFVRGIHRSPVNSPHKGQWRGALMFSLIHA